MIFDATNPPQSRSTRANLRRNANTEQRPRGRSRTARPALEILEDRVTPSTFRVTNIHDPVGRLVPGSLRWAITLANRPANQGSVVEITPAVQPLGATISLRAGELRLVSSMAIENDSGGPVTIQQDTPNARVLHVLTNRLTSTLTINGDSPTSTLTLTSGAARNANGGGILVDNPANILTLRNVNVTGNSAAQVSDPIRGTGGNGGGIYSRGTVTLDHSSVSGNSASGPNSATGHAGGVYTARGITLIASHVDGNAALNAAGILNSWGSVEVVDGSTVSHNVSTGNSFSSGSLGGGGIGQMNGNVLISNSQVNDNHTLGMYSGGIVLLIGGVVVTNGSQVNGNTNAGPGGGIAANFGGPVLISNGSQVNGNTGAGLGGGIVNFSETFPTIVTSNSEVSNNRLSNAEVASATGGLIQVFQSPPVRNAFLSGGRGDLALQAALQLFVNACGQRIGLLTKATQALPSNGQVQVGAGIATPLAGALIVSGNSTISGNRFTTTSVSTLPALGVGGGLFANLGPITIDNSTISGNDATGDGGGIWNGGLLTITKSTVTGNTAGGHGGGIFNRGTFVSMDNTISGNLPEDVFPQG